MTSDGTPTPEERKRHAAGICCFNWLGLVSTAAFICSMYSFAHCDFVSRYVALGPGYDPGDYASACADLGFGSESNNDGNNNDGIAAVDTWSTDVDIATNNAQLTICQSILEDHGIGFSYWQATIPVDQTVCFSYTQVTPWGYVKPEFDALFYASRVFSILGYCFGGAAWFTLTCSTCCLIDQSRLRGIAGYFLLASFSSGMSLLMFSSKVCQKGFFRPYFVPPSQGYNEAYPAASGFESVVEDVWCTGSLGSNMAIGATVLYFVCALMVPYSIVPFYQPRYYESDVEEQQHQAAPPAAPPATTMEQGREPVVQGKALPGTANA